MHTAFLRCIWRYRLTFALLLSFQPFISSLAQAHALPDKSVTVKIKNASLGEILKKLSKRTGIKIYYLSAEVSTFTNISLDVQKKALKDVLHELLHNRGLTWIEVNKTAITIKRRAILTSQTERAPSDTLISLSGRVINEKGNPVASATIVVRGAPIGTITTNDGRFLLKGVPVNSFIIISNVAYLTQGLAIRDNGDLGTIILKSYVNELDETIVIAYGTSNKRRLISNISKVSAEEIEHQPVSNPLLSLSGRVPGVQVIQASGLPGSGVKIQIQGQNSLLYGNDPFYVIDGVPYSAQLLPNFGTILGSSTTGGPYGANGNPLNLINPADIESIEILKDASATAIYGSRAANGAVLITTKKGQAGKIKVNINLQTGIGKVAKVLDLLKTPEYLQIRKESYQNDGLPVPDQSTPQDASNYDLTLWNQNKNTNWQKELIGGTAKYHDAQLTVSGGNSTTQYRIGGGYHKETGVFPIDLSNEKTSVHFNITSASENQRFKIMLTGSYLSENNKMFQTDLTSFAARLAPNAPELYNSDGLINWAIDENGSSSYQFDQPIAALLNRYNSQNQNLMSSTSMSYEIYKGLQFRVSGGYNNLQSNEIQYQLPKSSPPEYVSITPRKATYGDNDLKSWIIEPQITYDAKVKSGRLSLLLGCTFQKRESNRQVLEATGFDNDNSMDNIAAATSITSPPNTTISSIYKYNAIFGRINYNWHDRYIAEASIRRDGSSRFGSANLFHNFGAIGAAWLFTNESFLKDGKSILSFGKLKASYGTSGNDQIGDYAFLNLFDPNNQPVPYRGGTAIQPRTLSNPYLQWEETKKLNIGVDLGFLNDRLSFSINYFRNRSSNQLLLVGLPSTTGPSSISTNLPALVQNTGVEISISNNNIQRKDFSWTTSVNLTLPKNKLLSFESLESSVFYKNMYLVGQPVNIIRSYNFSGVNSTTGIYEFIDKDGKRSSTNPTTDLANRTVLLNPNQRLYGGISNTITYRSVTIDFLFQFVKQEGRNYKYGLVGYGVPLNQPSTFLDRWKQEGDEGKLIQKQTATDYNEFINASYISNTQASFGDASYIRLKNVSLSWNVPNTWISKIKVESCSVFAHAQNLWTITNYFGLDPETLSTASLPPLRTITFGIKAAL